MRRSKAGENSTSDFDRRKLQERLAKLVGGVAVISAGVLQRRSSRIKLRLEDTLNLYKAAVEEGIVAGSAVHHLSCAIDKGV